MIRGIHGMFYSSDADGTRAFLRDVLELPFTDVGEGWLIFDLPAGDLGVHPIDEDGQPTPGTHDVSFYCDDLRGTVATLRARGVQFAGEIDDRGYGLVTHFTMPGGIEVQLYQPHYVKRRVARTAKRAGKARARPAPRRGKAVGTKQRSAAGRGQASSQRRRTR
jgi:hypothetical protein